VPLNSALGPQPLHGLHCAGEVLGHRPIPVVQLVQSPSSEEGLPFWPGLPQHHEPGPLIGPGLSVWLGVVGQALKALAMPWFGTGTSLQTQASSQECSPEEGLWLFCLITRTELYY